MTIKKREFLKIVNRYYGDFSEDWLMHQCRQLDIPWETTETLDLEKASELAILVGTNSIVLIGKDKSIELQESLEHFLLNEAANAPS